MYLFKDIFKNKPPTLRWTKKLLTGWVLTWHSYIPESLTLALRIFSTHSLDSSRWTAWRKVEIILNCYVKTKCNIIFYIYLHLNFNLMFFVAFSNVVVVFMHFFQSLFPISNFKSCKSYPYAICKPKHFNENKLSNFAFIYNNYKWF